MLIATAAVLVLVVGPLLVGMMGELRTRAAARTESAVPWDWKLAISSMLLYALAFNLVFFIQELFLVLPKAFVPGLRPTLFHNNHTWVGADPLASLLQGTGALAIFATGIACALILRWRPVRSPTLRLFLIWVIYNGFFQSLPQVVIGALNPSNDVGMAMQYLRLSTQAKAVAALLALAAIPVVALLLLRPLLGLASDPSYVASARARTRFIFNVATLPALVAILLIVPFRVPRELIEVIVLPAIVTVIGIAWLQAGAWRVREVMSVNVASTRSIAVALTAFLLLLLVFQLVLRPGIRFY